MPRRLRRPPHPLLRIPARSPLLPFSTRNGPTSNDQTVDAAASTTAEGAADAIADGDVKAAGATGDQDAICRPQNMLRQSPLIRGLVNLSRTSRPRLTISRLFSQASRSRSTKIEFRPLLLRSCPRSSLSQLHRPSQRNRRSHLRNSCGIPSASSLRRACLIHSIHLPTHPRTPLSRL